MHFVGTRHHAMSFLPSGVTASIIRTVSSTTTYRAVHSVSGIGNTLASPADGSRRVESIALAHEADPLSASCCPFVDILCTLLSFSDLFCLYSMKKQHIAKDGAYQSWLAAYRTSLSDEDLLQTIARYKAAIYEGKTLDGGSVLCNDHRPIKTTLDLDLATDICLRRQQTHEGPMLRVCGHQELFMRLTAMHEQLEAIYAKASRDRQLVKLGKAEHWYRIPRPEGRLYENAITSLYGVDRAMCDRIVRECRVCSGTAAATSRRKVATKRTAEEAELQTWTTVAEAFGWHSPQTACDFFSGKRTLTTQQIAKDVEQADGSLKVNADLLGKMS